MAGGEFLEPALEEKVNIARRDRNEILKDRFGRLSEADQSLFQSGSVILSLNSSLCGLVANTLVRRLLHVTQAPFASGLPMVVLPFISTMVVYEASINQPLMEGDLNCATCAWIRGGAIGAFVGSAYPIFLAFPLNAALASRYKTSPMPSKENTFQYWKSICKPVFSKMKFAILLQIVFGTYLSSKHHEIYLKMLQQPAPGKDPEELE
nr:transmembrane protein 126A-like [Anolis sagrei ordinatus]